MSELLVQYTAPICCLQTEEVNTKNFMQILFDPRLELEDAQQHSPSPHPPSLNSPSAITTGTTFPPPLLQSTYCRPDKFGLEI